MKLSVSKLAHAAEAQRLRETRFRCTQLAIAASRVPLFLFFFSFLLLSSLPLFFFFSNHQDGTFSSFVLSGETLFLDSHRAYHLGPEKTEADPLRALQTCGAG